MVKLMSVTVAQPVVRLHLKAIKEGLCLLKQRQSVLCISYKLLGFTFNNYPLRHVTLTLELFHQGLCIHDGTWKSAAYDFADKSQLKKLRNESHLKPVPVVGPKLKRRYIISKIYSSVYCSMLLLIWLLIAHGAKKSLEIFFIMSSGQLRLDETLPLFQILFYVFTFQ